MAGFVSSEERLREPVFFEDTQHRVVRTDLGAWGNTITGPHPAGPRLWRCEKCTSVRVFGAFSRDACSRSL